jgi:hypothetical protein
MFLGEGTNVAFGKVSVKGVNVAVLLIFQGELFRILDRSSLSLKVNTILLSSLSSVVRGFKCCQALRMLLLIEDLEIDL